jgi:aminobenzoyl-glutamate transport protein
MATDATAAVKPSTGLDRFLNFIERAGNKLPDPALLFVYALLIVWALSVVLAPVQFAEIDPRNGMPIRVQNLLTGAAIATFLSNMVTTFVTFPPLGVVLVALLGVGVAEHVGFLTAMMRGLLNITPRSLLTPTVILVGCLSHTTADAGYVLVIPLGGVIFYTAGRHPLAGIAAAFAGVSGGFSANLIPAPLDPLLQGFTQTAAQIIAPGRVVNPLGNYYFTMASTFLVMGVGWFITERVIEPRLATSTPVDADIKDLQRLDAASIPERRGLKAGMIAAVVCLVLLALAAAPCCGRRTDNSRCRPRR